MTGITRTSGLFTGLALAGLLHVGGPAPAVEKWADAKLPVTDELEL